MASLSRRNRIQQQFLPGSTIAFSLPPGGKVTKGELIITGTVTLATTTAGTVIGDGAPTGLIKRIRVAANRSAGSRYPGGNLVDCTPRSLLRNSITQRNGKFFTDLNGATLGNGASGTYAVYLAIPIYWADSTLRNQYSTSLNLDPTDSQGNGIYSSVQVQVDCASDLSQCFSGWTGTVTFNLSVQWVDERFSLTGDTVPLIQESHPFIIPTANTRSNDFAMPQDGAFMSWMILGEQGAYKTLSDTLVNRVTLAGPNLDLDLYANDVKQQMLDDEWYDPAQSNVGQYYIDFSGGNLMNSVPAQSIAANFDLNNPSGSNLDGLNIFTRRVFALAP